MLFEWDDRKDAANRLKHDLSFEEAKTIFEGNVLSWIDERADYGETRQISIGTIRGVVAIAVVHTDRRGIIRIISARLANRREKRLYDEHYR